MAVDDSTKKTIDPNQDHPALTDHARDQIGGLARRQHKANGVLMKAITFVGGQVEDTLKLLPESARGQIDNAARNALTRSYELAAKSQGMTGSTDRWHKIMATMSGAIGGVGGLPTALAEIPVATTMIFRAVQSVAEQYGEDPTSDETRMQCLAVFGAGAPGPEDDGIDTAFFGARLGLTGPALNTLIARVAPRFTSILSQKLATSAVPIMGAAAGAGTNYAFIDYYIEVAHVHFALRRLSRIYGDEAVEAAFHVALQGCKVPVIHA